MTAHLNEYWLAVPQVGLDRRGARWRWSVCVKNRKMYLGFTFTRWGARRMIHRALRDVT